jgi:RNA polymerase sigma factor (sigma-70 family)
MMNKPMDEQDKVWETIYGIARQVASRANRIHRGLVSTDDLYQHLSLWALEHWHKIEQWQAEESLKFKLRKTFYNEAQKYVAKERTRYSRSPMSDSFYYTHQVLHELLPDVWEHVGWTDTPDMTSEFIAHSSKPSEGGNRLALLSDVAAGLARLNKNDKDLLRFRYAQGGMDFAALAESYGASDEAMRKRVKRALDKLQDRLGGEPPVWRGRRRVRSNAEAQAEIRNQEEMGD